MLDLRSKPRRRVLTYYLLNPSARLHVRELARRLDVDASNLARELARLEREGLLSSEIEGRQKYFRLNRHYPLLKEVQSIVQKTIGAAERIREAVAGCSGVCEAFLYGSYASGRHDAASDIDLMVIGNLRPGELETVLRKLERELGRAIGLTIMGHSEFRTRQRKKDPFMKHVMENPRIQLVDAA